MSRKRFTPLSTAEVFRLPDPKWLIQRVLPERGLGVLFGPPGIGKSFVALDMALSVSQGIDWLSVAEVRSGPILYVVAEGRAGLKFRLRAWEATHPRIDNHPQHWIVEPVQLLDPTSLSAFLRIIDEEHPPKLIVIDTLARCFAGGNENETEDMNTFVAALDTIRHETGAAVLVVHHTGRAEEAQERARGNTALDGAADSMFFLQPGKQIRLRCTKQKDAEEFRPIKIRFQPIQLTETSSSLIVLPED